MKKRCVSELVPITSYDFMLINHSSCFGPQVADVLDLNNSDLIACVVIPKDGQKMRRFLGEILPTIPNIGFIVTHFI